MEGSTSPPAPQEWVTTFLKAQARARPNLESDMAHQIIYDKSVMGSAGQNTGDHVKTVIVSTFMTFPWSPICFAPYVGNGMLAAAVIPYSDHMSNSAIFHEAQYRHLDHLVRAQSESAGAEGQQLRSVLVIRTGSGNVPAPEDPFGSLTIPFEARVLEVGDGVSFDVSEAEPAENREDYGRNHPSNAGIILAMKICGALAAQGYDTEKVHSVGSLVANNLATAYQHQVINMHFEDTKDTKSPTVPVLEEDIEGQKKDGIVKPLIGKMLRMLLDPTLKRSRTVRMNSNEIVLLINDLGQIDGVSLRAVTSTAIGILQDEWNICPVRVYAGHFMESHISGFSITLLNVVNTDIGGPSMIQLLDAPCDTQGWNSFAIREKWYGRNMLSKEEKDPPSLVPDRELSLSVSVDDVRPEFDESSSESEGEFEEKYQAQTGELAAHIPMSTRHTNKSINNSPSPPATFPTAMVDHGNYVTKPDSPPMSPTADEGGKLQESPPMSPKGHKAGTDELEDDLFPMDDVVPNSKKVIETRAPAQFSYDEPVRPAIVHPTWQHGDEDRSLVDLIRSQAARLELAATATLGTDKSQGADLKAGSDEKTAVRKVDQEDDDFELVEG